MKSFSISEWIVKGFFMCMGAMIFLMCFNFVVSMGLYLIKVKGF